MVRRIVLILTLCFSMGSVMAQGELGVLASMAKESPALAKDIFQEYMNPYGEMFGVGLNSGWYNTSKVHSTLGFDVTVTASWVTAPKSASTFDIQSIVDKYPGFTTTNGTSPTIIGDNSNIPTVGWQTNDLSGNPIVVGVKLPEGLDFRHLPLPMFKVGLGLPKNFEIMGRFSPQVKLADFKVGMWGLGARWQFSEAIPVIKRVPFLAMTVMGAYTSVNSTYGIDFAGDDGVSFNDQEIKLDAGAFTGRLLVGANFPFINLYVGAGYGTATTKAMLNGTYPVAFNPAGKLVSTQTIKDPFDLKFDNSGIDFNAGLRVKMAVVTIHVDYTVGKYNVLSGGLGISFR
ncbi:MAG: hypothetical protein N4A72_17645 [Bacteroidales bacterium]|nr:hypothetical protein [Bacteroidales bacterium]